MGKFAKVVAVIWLIVAAHSLSAQSGSPPAEEKGTYLGVLFGPVSEALYDQIPQIPRDQGVLVTLVLLDSPAAEAGVRRHDVLLRYDDHAIRNCEHFANLIQQDKPERKVKLTLLRESKERTVEATLRLGPVLKIAQGRPGPREADLPRGVAKQGGPPSVNVAATPLEQGKMKVVIEYYAEDAGRLKTVTCEGTPADVDREIQKQLPERERNLARIAVQRFRDLNPSSPKTSEKRNPAKP
jgi:hypothetical protein